jgi:excisionase family DNA binding protein
MTLFTVPEAARKAGVSAKMVRQAIYDEELEAAKFGPSWMITEEDLTAWIEALDEDDDADDDVDDDDAGDGDDEDDAAEEDGDGE